jgi:hypothetical protein
VDPSTLLSLGLALLVVVILGAIIFRAMGLAGRHSQWLVSVHYRNRPDVDLERVSRALAVAFPGAALTTRMTEPQQWVASHPEHGDYVVKLRETLPEPTPDSPTKFRVDLSVIAPGRPSESGQGALLEALCTLAEAFARQGAAFISRERSFPSPSDTPTVVRVDAAVLEQLAAGRTSVFEKPGQPGAQSS